jgi:ribonuclease T2
MKGFLAAVLLLLAAAPALAADDCILDNCADRRPPPHAQGAPDAPRPSDFRRGGAPAGDFDFYVLALSWSPSFCEMGGARRSPAQCARGANPGFVVHGLWPQNDNGYPSNCPGNPFLPFAVLSRLGDLYPDPGLARHEWRQHGLCSGESPSAYFADVRVARDAIVVPPAFRAPEADQRLSPLAIQRAFIEANPRLRPGMMAVTCRRGLFQEARFCLSKDLRNFVACPQVARQGCYSQSVVAPAAR